MMTTKEKDCISRQIGRASLQIDYEYGVPDSVRLAHMVLLEKYWKNFKESDVFIWVPDGADEECEYGVYPACKEIILTNADAAKEAFGADWVEEHIFTATITWAIPDGEYDRLVSVYDGFVEQDRINRIADRV